jgi:hypothetical protein
MTAKQVSALQALLTHPTRREACQAAGIAESTLRRYLDDPVFQKEYHRAFGSLVEDAVRQSQQALSPALSALREIVADSKETSSARISAARSLLEYGLKLSEFNEHTRMNRPITSEADDDELSKSLREMGESLKSDEFF